MRRALVRGHGLHYRAGGPPAETHAHTLPLCQNPRTPQDLADAIVYYTIWYYIIHMYVYVCMYTILHYTILYGILYTAGPCRRPGPAPAERLVQPQLRLFGHLQPVRRRRRRQRGVPLCGQPGDGEP